MMVDDDQGRVIRDATLMETVAVVAAALDRLAVSTHQMRLDLEHTEAGLDQLRSVLGNLG